MNAVAAEQTLGAAEKVTAGRTGRANEDQNHFLRISSLLFNKGGTQGEQTTAQNQTAGDRPSGAPLHTGLFYLLRQKERFVP